MKIAIYSRTIDQGQFNQVQYLFDELDRQQIQPVVYHHYFNMIQPGVRLPGNTAIFRQPADLDESIDFLISLGGDGTLLDTVSLVQDKNIPVLGINFGRLGFLASISKDEVATAVTALINRTFVVDKRSMVHLMQTSLYLETFLMD